jgi:type IX secretion system PorP/SprF family membrane protein
MFQDKAGSQRLTTIGALLTASYHLSLDKRSRNVLTLGAQYETISRNINFREIISEGNNFNSTVQDPEFPNGNEKTGDYKAVNVGLMFRSKFEGGGSLELGARMLHIGAKSFTGFASIGNQSREANLGAHARVNFPLNEKWSAEPTAFWQTTPGGGNEIQIQAWGIRQLKTDINLRMGLGYRNSDAAKVLFGIDYKDLRAAVAYDLNVSSANAITNYQGGFEIAAYYIIKIYKKPTLKPAILCPRL